MTRAEAELFYDSMPPMDFSTVRERLDANIACFENLIAWNAREQRCTRNPSYLSDLKSSAVDFTERLRVLREALAKMDEDQKEKV